MSEGRIGDVDEFYMAIAVEEARKALVKGNPPIGAVVLIGGKIVATASNTNTTAKTWLGHAEQNALRKAAQRLRYAGEVSGEQSTLYSTLEPCLMCLASALYCRVSRVVYGIRDFRCGGGGLGSFSDVAWYSQRIPIVVGGVLAVECDELFREYVATPPYRSVENT